MATPRPEQQSDIKQLISKGLEQGYLTYAEINDHLPDDVVDPEAIEDIIGMINGMGIEVHEVAPDAETLLLTDATPTRDTDETAAEEAAAALSALDAEGGRTTDPVRMYMREMGTVELLTREGEIAIAKRIEEGLHQVQSSLAAFPWTIQLILDDYAQHQEGRKRLNEIVVGFADLETPELFGGVPIEAAADEDEEVAVEGGDEEETETVTGPDPVEVARRMELIKTLYAKFERTHAKYGSLDKKTIKAREEMAAEFMKLKLPLALIDALVRKVRDVVAETKEHERRVLDIATRLAKMPRKDFIKAWPGQETNTDWADEIIRRKQKWSSGIREHRGAIIAEHPAAIDLLSVGEAVMRMDLAHVPVLMFRNTATRALNVVYRRADGNVGWIDPGAA